MQPSPLTATKAATEAKPPAIPKKTIHRKKTGGPPPTKEHPPPPAPLPPTPPPIHPTSLPHNHPSASSRSIPVRWKKDQRLIPSASDLYLPATPFPPIFS